MERSADLTKLGPYEVHPFADAFPLLDGDEFAELVADIKRNGLREPILLNHSRTVLVDGRNRYRACEAAGAAPTVETLPEQYTQPMILDLIVSKNLARRQLNPGQRALMALEYDRFYSEATKVGRPIGNAAHAQVAESEKTTPDLESFPRTRNERTSAAKAAAVVGASRSAVAQAKAVQRDAPDLAAKVRTGEIALDAADKQRRQRIAAMPKPDPIPVKPSPVLITMRTHDGREISVRPSAKPTFTDQSKTEGISWAKWSWNPVTGCLHGCEYCYARAITQRFPEGFPAGFTPFFREDRLSAPANTVVPAEHRDDPAWQRVFVCSMADLYGRWVPQEWINRVHASMLASPHWQYILLTKFPARYVGLDMPAGAWIGTSVDEQKRVRIAEDAFRQVDGGMVRWLSLEPLKEPLEFTDLSMFDWVVIGAQTETVQGGRVVPAFAPAFEWVARIVAQAREAGCRVHLKPNLVNGRPGMQRIDEYPSLG